MARDAERAVSGLLGGRGVRDAVVPCAMSRFSVVVHLSSISRDQSELLIRRARLSLPF